MERRGVSLNLNVRGLRHSATLAVNDTVRRLRASGRPVYNMGLGESPFPVPAGVVASLRQHAHEKAYLPVQGLPALRQAVAEYMQRTQRLPANADDVLIGPGSKELLFLLQLSFYGDIIVPSPCWVSYTPQAQILGRRVNVVDTRPDDWKVTPDLLAAVLAQDADKYRPRIFVLNYPANPTGVSYTDAELRALAAVAREFEVIILADEIYSGLRHDGEHVSIARHYPEGTIVLDGISKWPGAGGWRLGAFVFPPELEWLRDTMAAVASETYTSVCTPVQHAAVQAFAGGAEMERVLAAQRSILAALTSHAHAMLRGAGVRVARPDGAYYLFPDFTQFRRRLSRRHLHTGVEFCQRVLEDTGVAMLPGSAFQRPRGEATARMSLVDFDGGAALTALGRGARPDEAWLRQHAPRAMQGLDVLVAWLQKR